MAELKKLMSGDTIGVIAISAPVLPERLEAGLAYLKSQGFNPKVILKPGMAYGRSTYLFSSDTPKARAYALMKLFRDKSVKAIICGRGAYGSMEVLPLLNFKVIKENPKPIVGFSDVTALQLACWKKAKLISIHGPMLSGALAETNSSITSKNCADTLIAFLKGELLNPFESIHLRRLGQTSNKLKPNAKVAGRLLGGNLCMIASLMGTPWEPNFDKSILFLEESGEKPYKVHRMLLQMKLAGKFRKLAGVLIGYFSQCESSTGPSVEEVFLDIFGNIPVYVGAPFGHISPNFPLPVGAMAQIRNGKLLI